MGVVQVTLTCKEVREQLSAWLDGELGGTAQAAVKTHVDRCPVCREEMRQLTLLEAALGNLAAPVPPGLAEKVLDRLQPRRRRYWWQSMAMAASLLVGIVLGGAVARDFYPREPENGMATEVAALEAFHDFPQGSLGMILATYQPDEINGSGK